MSMKATSRVLELKKKREESIANMSNIVSELDQSQVSQINKNEDLNFSQMAAIRARQSNMISPSSPFGVPNRVDKSPRPSN